MAMTPSRAVREFHTEFGIPKVHPDDTDAVNFRMLLITEEFREVLEASGLRLDLQVQNTGEALDKAHLLKELADLAYVIYGTAESFGWDLDEAIRRVHVSNMSKLDVDGSVIKRADGKVMKGPNYQEPYLGDLV